MGFGLVWMLFLLLIAVAVVLWLVTALFPQARPPAQRRAASGPDEGPWEAARRRYAAGEISKEEFDSARRGGP